MRKELPDRNLLKSCLPIEIAVRRVALIPGDVVDSMVQTLESRLSDMRTCSSSVREIHEMNFAMQVSMCIEDLGVVRGLRDRFCETMDLLKLLEKRFEEHAGKGLAGSCPLRGPEIRTLEEAIDLHRFQLEKLSAGEFSAVFRKAAARHRPQLLRDFPVK